MPAEVAAAAAAELAAVAAPVSAPIEVERELPIAQEAQPESIAEPEPAPVAEAEPELVAEPDPAPVAEPELEPVAEPESEPAPVAEAEQETVAESEFVAEPETVDETADAEPAEVDNESSEAPVLDVVGYAELVDLAPGLVEDDVDRDDDDDPLAYVYEQARLEASLDEESSALVLRGVSKSFGDMTAVEAIDLTVPAGTFYGLVGPNGAGKTTTLSMIAGLLTPDRGVIRVGGVDAASDPLGAKKLMGVLPDRLRTFDRLTGRQLLYYYGILRGLPARVVESRSADLARAFDLTDSLGRVVSDYSAGMLKKVMLAGAMIHSPRVLVLDEPFESVDPVSSAVILDILSAYVAHGGTVILSSHGMELVERVCTRVAVIVAGQVLAEGTIDEVRGELTLEQRFVELAGGLSDVEGLEWLHTFSD
ncbi:ATP-binding cassette domain-containing protein [Microbacterium sp. SLBN-146]|uniref:ATP-binding cassette domain-containing protein n=1 Tax=Microbacterium sp. SLBN-146 TaxID=2768457 RepID=UPI0011534CFC|nr:ATP-binding cassette domain-containing protein [Microbacterium sp. SLBN-146]